MSKTKDIVIDQANAAAGNGIVVTVEQVDLRRVTKAELHARASQMSDKARDLSQKLQEAYTEIATLKETASDIMNGQSVLAKSAADAQATIAAHEKTIADLEAKVKDLSQWPAIAHEMARNNTRLVATVDNMAKAAAGLVPPAVMQAVNR